MTTTQDFYLDKWLVSQKTNCIKNDQIEIQIEPKLMDVLVYLCQHSQQVITTDQLIENCWPNQYISDNPIHKCIAQIRKALQDDAKKPRYIKTWPKKGYSVIAPVKGLHKETPDKTTYWSDGPPYPGLNSYGANEAEIFFGRNKAISEIKYQINKINNNELTSLWLMGPNGVGKTSIMKAVILPYLSSPDYPFHAQFKKISHHQLTTQERCSLAFFQYLKQQQIVDPLLSDQQLVDAAHNNSLQFRHFIQTKENAKNQSTKTVIFIDQLECIFLGSQNKQDIDVFLLILKQLLNNKNILLIVALQYEYYAQIMQSAIFLSIKHRIIQYDLLPPETSELVEIVKKPVLAAGFSYQFDTNTYSTLDQKIISDMSVVSNVLPLLNHTLRELCLQANAQKLLTFKAYENMGGLTGSVAYKANDFFSQCNDDQINSFKSKLHYLIQISDEPEHKLLCTKADLSYFKDDLSAQVVSHLLNERLLHSELIDNKTYISIVHESLLNQCQLFKSWISRNRLKLSLSKEIKNRANHWNNNNCHPNYLLYNHSLLNETKTLVAEQDFIFNAHETTFIDASLQKQKHKKWLKHFVQGTLVGLFIICAILLVKFQNINQELNDSHEKAENLIGFMVEELKENLKSIGKLDLLDDIGQQVMAYYGTNPENYLALNSVSHRIEALNTLGEVKIKQGELNTAEKYFMGAKQQYEQHLKGSPSTTDLLFKVSQSHYWLGYLAYLQKNSTLTEKHWLDYLSISEQLVTTEPANNQWQLELSYALNNLGTLNFNRQDYEQASLYINESATIKESLLKAEPQNTQFMAELADTLSWQASIADKNHQLESSKHIHEKSLLLTQQIYALEPKNQIWKHRLAQAHYRLALKNYDIGALTTAQSETSQSLNLFQQLHEVDNSNQQWTRELVNTHLLLAKIHKHNQQLDDAMLNINLGLKYTESYSTETLNLNSSLIQNLNLIAESSLILLRLKQPKAALSQFEKMADKFKQLDQTKSDDMIYYQAYSFYILGKIQAASNQTKLSAHSMQQSQKLIEELIAKNIKQHTYDKKSMALSILISKQINQSVTDQKMIDFLNQTNYKNPDYKLN